MSELLKSEYSVIDVETTGFSPTDDRIVEIAVVRINGTGTVLDEWHTLIDPVGPVGASKVHSITEEQVTGAPVFDSIAGDFLEMIDGSVLVAHNYGFDHGFVDAGFSRSGHTFPAWPSLCTLQLSRRFDPRAACHKLGDVCQRRGLASPDHTALSDARSTAQLLAAILGEATLAGQTSLQDLKCRWFPVTDVPRIEPSGQVKERSQGKSPVQGGHRV